MSEEITWYGAPGSFGPTLPGHTTDAFKPTGTSLVVGTWLPTVGTLSFETIPTTTGVLNPLSLSLGGGGLVGGADFEDIARYSAGGVERYVLCVGRPYNDWRIGAGAAPANQGIYPTFVVLTKQGGVWRYDASLSKTAEQVRASNPTAATSIYVSGTTPVTGETNTGSRNTSELDVFPQSGHIVVTHYDDATGAGLHSGALSVLDTSLALKAGYLCANVEYPTGHTVPARPRGIQVDPTSALNDERFVVAYDVLDVANTPAGIVLDGAANSCVTAPDSATWNVAGLLEIAMRVRLPDYTPAAGMYLMAHHEPTGNQRSWAFFLNAAGTLLFTTSSTGVNTVVNTSSAAPALTDGNEYWLGVSYNTTTGVLSFYKANGAQAMPARWAGWTQIGATTTPGATALFDSTATLSIGASGSFFSNPLIGDVYRAALYSAGTLVADANFGPDGAPLATPNAASYTDALGKVWTVRGTAVINNTNRFMVQEFSYNASGPTITAKSQPFYTNNAGYRPEQVQFDDAGTLWVTQTFGGIFNGVLAVYEKSGGERAPVTQWPASGAWTAGDGSTSTQWSRGVTPTTTVDGTGQGGLCAGLTWDAANKVMYATVGTSGVIAVQRSGAGAPYAYSYVGLAGTYFDEAPGANGPARAVLDSHRKTLWVPTRQLYSSSYPTAPAVLDQWVVGIQLGFWLPTVEATIPDSAYFDGTVRVRGESVRFDLTDVDGNVLGALMVERDTVPKITNDTGRSIRRTLDNIVIPPRPVYDVALSHYYAEDVNPLVHRVAPWWLLDNGSTFPLGVFAWGDDSQVLWSWGSPRHASLVDLGVGLDQPLAQSIGFGTGNNVTDALAFLADGDGFGPDRRQIDESDMALGAPIGVTAGSDTRLKAYEALCAAGSFLPVYFDNTGTLVCRVAPQLASAQPDFTYVAGSLVIPGSAVTSNDLLTAPNRYVVTSGNATAEIVGVYDIPDSAPNSFANIGYYRVKSSTVQGIPDAGWAAIAAYAAYVKDRSMFTHLSFDTPVDPRHDTWDVLSFYGVSYLQTAWTIECAPGGLMHHTCRGAPS